MQASGYVLVAVIAVLVTAIVLVIVNMKLHQKYDDFPGALMPPLMTTPPPPPKTTIAPYADAQDVIVVPRPAVLPGQPMNVVVSRRTPVFRDIGFLSRKQAPGKPPLILALWGRPNVFRRERYEYYATRDRDSSVVRFPVQYSGNTCASDPACKELHNGDAVLVPGFPGGTFRVTLY